MATYDKKYIASLSWEQFKAEADEQTAAAVANGTHAWFSNYGVDREAKLRNLYDECTADNVKPATVKQAKQTPAVQETKGEGN